MADVLYASDEVMELESTSFSYRFSLKELWQVLGIGAVLGLLTPALTQGISTFAIAPFFCRTDSSFSFCAEGGSLAFGISLISLSIAGLLLLATLRTYQPLLNVVAALASLWGIDQLLQTLFSNHRVEFFIVCGALSALAYGLYYLLLRIKNFPISVGLILIMVILVRLQF